MTQYFAYDYHGAPFVFFGPGHLIALAVILFANLALLAFRRSSPRTRLAIRGGLVVLICLSDLSWQFWNIYWRQWSVRSMLPLHLCSLMLVLAIFLLITKNYHLYEFVYFLGIGGAIQALLTPPVGIYGFPHFRVIQTFLAHGLLLTTGVYMTVVEGLRPTWKSLLRVLFVAILYMLFIGWLDHTIGANYLYLASKPLTPSMLDLLPVWPWYIPWMVNIGLGMSFLLYIPFAAHDIRRKTISKTS